MEHISFQRSSKVHGLEMLWLKGNVLGVMSSTSTSMACGDGEAGGGSPETELAILHTWM